MCLKFWEELRIKKINISLKDYGKDDIGTAWEVSALIDNKSAVMEVVDNLVQIKEYTLDDYIRYLYVMKLSKFEEIIKLLARDEDIIFFSTLVKKCNDYLNKANDGELIKYLNYNIQEVFQLTEIPSLKIVTLSIVKKYQNGLENNVIGWLCENYGYLILHDFSSFYTSFEKNPDNFDKLFNDKNLELYHSTKDTCVFDILAHIKSKKNNNLKVIADKIDEKLHLMMIKLAQSADKNNALLLQHYISCYLMYLKKIKSSKANEFIRTNKNIEKLVDEGVHENGQGISYRIPVDEILKRWDKTELWPFKQISITHDMNSDGRISVRSRLSTYNPNKKKTLTDTLIKDDYVDDYFTVSHKLELSIKMSVGASTIMGLLREKHDEIIEMGISVINYLANCLDNEDIIKDVNRMFISIDFVLASKEDIVQETLLYGAAVQICACIEKLLRLAYIDVFKDRMYIPLKKATLGSLLKDNKDEWLNIFSYHQLQVIGYYLITMGEKSIGHNYRNRLAHMEDGIEKILSLDTMCSMLYLYFDVVNTLFVHYMCENEINGKKEK